jgi:hypothetical protein
VRHAVLTCAAGILCLSLAVPSAATVYFENTGVTSGWDIKTQRTGTVTQVTSPSYDGGVLRARIIYEASDGNRYHAEAIKRGLAYNGQDRYYGQAIYLPSGYNDHTVVQQWATEGPEGPWLGMNADAGVLKWDAVRGPMTGGPAAAFATVPLARWFRVVARLNMKTTGVLEVWVDGTKRLTQTGDWSTGYASGSSIRWSTGIYMSNWHRSPPTGAHDVSVHHDHFRIASSMAEAEPANWGNAPVPTPTPTATPTPTPTNTPGGAFTEITPPASGVTASTSDANIPGNTVDNTLATRWSGNGDGTWIQYDLGSERTVAFVNVAVYQGNARRNRFDIQVATTLGQWTTVRSAESSGTTTTEETYDFDDVSARWVRYLGHGNIGSTNTAMNSVTEVSIFTPNTPAVTPTPTATPIIIPTPTPTAPVGPIELTPAGAGVTASTNDGNLPANTVDDNLATRWSGSGDGAWIQYDLGGTHTVTSLRVAWYQGNTRVSTFDVLTSDSPTGPWTTLAAGRTSSGTTTTLETHDIPDGDGRHVRVVGHGNTLSGWNSITEVQIWGVP